MVSFSEGNPADQAFDALLGGQHVRALAMIDQLIAAEPASALYRCWHSHCLLALGSAAEALESARQAARLDGRLVQAYLCLAWAASRLNRRQEAQDAFEMALTLSGREGPVLTEYANFLATQRGPAIAEKVAREAVAAQPDSADAWRALGWTLFRLHRHEEAEGCLQRALALAPSDPAALVCTIELLNHTGQPERAAELTAVLRENPKTADLAEALDREVAARLRILGRAGPRLNRFLPPVEEGGGPWRARVRQCFRLALWLGGLALLVVGGADAFASGRLLPFGVGPFLAILGALLVGVLWHTRSG